MISCVLRPSWCRVCWVTGSKWESWQQHGEHRQRRSFLSVIGRLLPQGGCCSRRAGSRLNNSSAKYPRRWRALIMMPLLFSLALPCSCLGGVAISKVSSGISLHQVKKKESRAVGPYCCINKQGSFCLKARGIYHVLPRPRTKNITPWTSERLNIIVSTKKRISLSTSEDPS